MNKNKHHCSILLLAGWIIMLVGCQHAPSFLLKKVIQNIRVTSLAMFLFRYKYQRMYVRLYNDFLGTKKMQI